MNAFLDSLDDLKLTFQPHISSGVVMAYDVNDFIIFLASRFYTHQESNYIPTQLYGVADDLNANINRLFANIEANYPSLDQGTVVVIISLVQSDGDASCRDAFHEVVRRFMTYAAAELAVIAAAAANHDDNNNNNNNSSDSD